MKESYRPRSGQECSLAATFGTTANCSSLSKMAVNFSILARKILPCLRCRMPPGINTVGIAMAKSYARAHAAFFRATFMPSLASALDCVGDAADQASNDFKSLFEVLAAPHSYARSDANLFTCALGRSFYENVLPPNSVHVAWSSYAAVWLSNVPMPIPSDLFCTPQSPAAARAAFERQAASVRECSRGFLAWQIADALVGCFPSWLRISFRHFFVVLAAPMKLPRPRDPLPTLPLPHCEGQ